MTDQNLSGPRFRDIKPYTRDGSYQTHVPLSHLEITLSDYQEANSLDMESDFQRAHVWDEPRQIAFVEHILRGGKGSELIRFNCPGWDRTFDGQMVVVDGKQRLTACLRFVRNDLPAFGHYHQDFQDRIPITINLRFMVNDLNTRKEVLSWCLEINEGGVAHTDQELAKVRHLLEAEIRKSSL